MKLVAYIEMDYNELGRLIKNYFGLREFEVVAIEEWSNDMKHSFSMKKEKIDDYDQRRLDQVRQGKVPNFCTRLLLQELVNTDLLPEGNYLIDVSW